MSRNLPSSVNESHAMNPSLPSTSYQIHSQAHLSSNEIAEPSDSSSLDSDEADFDDSPDYVPSGREKTAKIPLAATELKNLSKCGGSYRTMEKVLSIGIRAAGGDPDKFSISKASLCGQLSNLRASETSTVQQTISSSNRKVLIHFDEKKFLKINKKHLGKESRCVVICHTETNDFALGLPILESGTAESINNEIVGLCENHGLMDRIIGLVCDTTAVNTGENHGILVKFQHDSGRDLLNITCRHHVYEVLLSAAFRTAFGQIDAPTITIFDQLKLEMPRISERGHRYRACNQRVLNSRHLRALYNNAKVTLTAHSKSRFIRDDYAELNDLCLKFMGIRTEKLFMVPGSVSKARWMAKVIYAIKMFLFRDELELDEDFLFELLEFCLFAVVVYCKYWNQCTVAIDAAVNDLSFLEDLRAYSHYNENIANSVLNSFQNHFWYFGEELVVMSIFSDKVSIEEKNRMRLSLLSDVVPPRSNNSIRLKNYNDDMELPDMLTERSRFLFSILDIDSRFCTKAAETWKYDPRYKKAKKLVQDLVIVVNDSAESALSRAETIIQNQKARSELRFQNMFLSLFSLKKK